jgi:hypothetical protein
VRQKVSYNHGKIWQIWKQTVFTLVDRGTNCYKKSWKHWQKRETEKENKEFNFYIEISKY